MIPLIPSLCAIEILIDHPISNNLCFYKYFPFTGCCFPKGHSKYGKKKKKILQKPANEMHSVTVQMFISVHASYKSKLMRTVMARLSLS